MVTILNEIYEADFRGYSYRFRPGRSPHRALDALNAGIQRKRVNWILDADIRGFFDDMDHEWTMKFMEQRVADKRVLRPIGKWLTAGVSENGEWPATKVGTLQGAVVSPRRAKFGPEVHREKTRLIEFGRFAKGDRNERGEGKPETFTFLGFTHCCGRNSKGSFVVWRRTAAKRMRAKLLLLKRELRRKMHEPVGVVGQWLKRVVGGYYRYHGAPGNSAVLGKLRDRLCRLWRQALRRRSRRPNPCPRPSRTARRWTDPRTGKSGRMTLFPRRLGSPMTGRLRGMLPSWCAVRFENQETFRLSPGLFMQPILVVGLKSMTKTLAYAARSATSPLGRWELERREPGPHDVQIEITHCGVCHSDLHTVRNEWTGTVYPVVPGHEIIGRVTAIGGAVTKFKIGDSAGVGCLVDSCRTCGSCREGLEQYCENGMILTYNSPDKHTGKVTYGGYSGQIVVDEGFVLRVSAKLTPAGAAPLLCAGITTYSPLRHWNAGAGKKVGIVGLGGLGHMGVKFAHAFGAHTVLFTTSPSKVKDGRELGADEVTISRDAGAMTKHAASFDFILNTVAASHNLDPFLNLLKRDGTMCLVGAPAQPHPSPAVFNLIFKRRALAGSLIGGIAETQEMLDFCAAHRIESQIELIPIQKIDEAYDRMLKSDVKYRFVIDMASLK